MPSALTEDIKNARKCENINDPVDNYVIDYIAMVFSRIFIKLHIIPNAVTVLSAIVGVAGGIMLCFDTLAFNISGVLLIILAAVFDASDGQVARLTKHYSNLGRTLDGFADFLVYLSIYIAICVRLYGVNIPFTDKPWGLYIVPVAVVTMLLFGAQARAADYFKNLHMFMISRGKGSELSRAKAVKESLDGYKKFTFEHFRLKIYLAYTSLQEKKTPCVQKMLDKIARNGGVISEEMSEAFAKRSRKYVMSTNLLTFNLRTGVLFLLLFLPGHFEVLYFPFVVFVLEPVRFVIISKYERLARELTNQKFF